MFCAPSFCGRVRCSGRYYSTWVRLKARLFYANNVRLPQRLVRPRTKAVCTVPRVVVVGSGWSSAHFLKYLAPSGFDLTVISPRNYFAFTPLLPSVVGGVLPKECCAQPLRPLLSRKGAAKSTRLHEAWATGIDVCKQLVSCQDLHRGHAFTVPYDYLVLGMGASTNTLGVPGVDEHAFFLKEVEDAIRLRRSILGCFEKASLPGLPEEERKRLLRFVIVGAGPTGVEVAAELSDLVNRELTKLYADAARLATIVLIEIASKVLPTYSAAVSTKTLEVLRNEGRVTVLFGHRVAKMESKQMHVIRATESGEERFSMPFGLCVWAVGVANTPLAKSLLTDIPEQHGHRVLQTNQILKLHGTKNIFAMGDCKQIRPQQLSDGTDSVLAMNGGRVPPRGDWFFKNTRDMVKSYPQLSPRKITWTSEMKKTSLTSVSELKTFLATIDRTYRPPKPTAQNARQEGLYLATLFNEFGRDDEARDEQAAAFVERWWGRMAYIGNKRIVADFPFPPYSLLGGPFGLSMWRAVYLKAQLSRIQRLITSLNWLKVFLAGRAIDHMRGKTSTPRIR